MTLYRLFIASLFLMAGCETAPKINTNDLALFASLPASVSESFIAAGDLIIEAPQNKGTGKMMLAVNEKRYRIEVYDGTGMAISALVFDGNNQSTMNLKTGAISTKSIGVDDVTTIRKFGFAIPSSLLPTIVNGSLPPIKAISETFKRDDLTCAKSVGPSLLICYDELLRSVQLDSNDEEQGVITIHRGRFRNVSSVTLALAKEDVKIDILWRRIEKNPQFKEGFFTFQ